MLIGRYLARKFGHIKLLETWGKYRVSQYEITGDTLVRIMFAIPLRKCERFQAFTILSNINDYAWKVNSGEKSRNKLRALEHPVETNRIWSIISVEEEN